MVENVTKRLPPRVSWARSGGVTSLSLSVTPLAAVYPPRAPAFSGLAGAFCSACRSKRFPLLSAVNSGLGVWQAVKNGK